MLSGLAACIVTDGSNNLAHNLESPPLDFTINSISYSKYFFISL